MSEYVRELIRNDRRQTAKAVLEQELLDGVTSGPARTMTSADWRRLKTAAGRRRVRKSR